MVKIIPLGGPDESEARRRLLDVARERGSSLAELSRLLGRNPAYLQQYVARGSPRHLDAPDLARIAEFLGVNPRHIETRPLTMGYSALNGLDDDDYRAIPRLPLDASAGPGATGAQEIPYDSYRFSRRWLREMGLEGADLSAIRVEGDSMEPLLRSGEGVFVVRIGEALHVKQVRASALGTIALISANEAYAPLELPRDEVEVIGRVVWKGGRV